MLAAASSERNHRRRATHTSTFAIANKLIPDCTRGPIKIFTAASGAADYPAPEPPRDLLVSACT